MAASDPQGEMQFWHNGQPFGGVEKSGNDGGEMQYWHNGLPYKWIFPSGGAPPATVVKDIIGGFGVIPFPR